MLAFLAEERVSLASLEDHAAEDLAGGEAMFVDLAANSTVVTFAIRGVKASDKTGIFNKKQRQ